MAASVYKINKGINKSIEFKGLKAQYIWYLGAGIIGLLICFAILYIIGLNTFVCLAVILLLGAGLITYVYKLSSRYGQYGMMKRAARRLIPRCVKSRSQKLFDSR
jgi:hypothetical protein